MPGEETATDSPTAVDNISARTASYMESKFGTIVKEDEDVGAMNRSARMGTSPEEGIKHVSAKKSNVPLVTQVVDLKSYEGSNIDAKIASMTSKHGVVVFSKSFCPFCIEVKKTFQALNVPIHVFEVNVAPSGAHVHNSLKALTKHTTMPNVFIKGKHVGGCDDVKALQSTGALDEMLNDLVIRDEISGAESLTTISSAKRPRGQARHPLFWFPNVVNNYVVRLTGIQVSAICVVGIIAREERWAHWMIVFLLVDFFTRMVLGSYASVLGMIATLLSSPFKPQFKPGPPKQFASFCGLCFCIPVVALYFNGNYVAGAIILGLLLGAAAMEGFLNFCLGCVFFGLGIRFKLIPSHVYRIYANTKDSVAGAWDWANVTAKSAKQPSEVVFAGDKTPADLKYKRVKTDEYTIRDFDLVRHMQVSYFAMPLGLAGLATAWKLSSTGLQEWAVQVVGPAGAQFVRSYEVAADFWRTFATMAATVYILMLVLYTLRLVSHHNKCVKEWHCPMRSPGFGMISICCVLFSFLAYDQFDGEGFGRALWWIGSIVHVMLTTAKFGEWIGKPYELEHVHPSWIILPVGGFVSALVAPIVRAVASPISSDEATAIGTTNDVELASFFYAFAFLMWIVLFTVTFYKVTTSHNSDARQRSQVFIWVAPPAIAALANFVSCFSRVPNAVSGLSVGECVQNFNQLYYVSVMLLLGLLWAFLPYINFFGRNPFDMSYWNFVFSLDAFAAASGVYHSITHFKIAEFLFFASLAVATVANLIALLHTLVALVRQRGVFTPAIKWGPLSFMKLTHEGVRGALPHMQRCLAKVDVTDKGSIQVFACEFAKFLTLHHEHANHEDLVAYKEFERFFPHHARQWLDDHEKDRVLLRDLEQKINTLLAFANSTDGCDHGAVSESEATALVNELRDILGPFVEHFLVHLDGEEENLNPIGRKHIPLAIQRTLVQRVWEVTPIAAWTVIIPYMLENMPRIPQRKKYIRSLIWGLGPERAQQVGTIVYKNCDAVMWEVLAQDIPEIIPRGVPGWRRYY
eukprot:m.418837 g.418837  ORF g.418837 m.418837 type:complete len:1030 (-) comp21294_c1_seq7:310-3399(-)